MTAAADHDAPVAGYLTRNGVVLPADDYRRAVSAKFRADLAAVQEAGRRYVAYAAASAAQSEVDKVHAAVLDAAAIANGDVDRYRRLFGDDDLPTGRTPFFAAMEVVA